MGRRLAAIALLLLAAGLLCGRPSTAWAGGGRARALHAHWAPDRPIIDGLPNEWGVGWRELGFRLRGAKPGSADLRARAALSYDRENVYLAAEVQDERLVGRGDYVELVLGIPGGTVWSLRLYPGVAGRSAARALSSWGALLADVEVVEAPIDGGYGLEARIPWKRIPRSSTIRLGLRGGVFVYDADRSRAVETVMGTAPSRAYRSLPAVSTEPEIALSFGLLREHGLYQAPRYNLLGNVKGDRQKERILVYGRYLVVLGPSYDQGKQYYYRELGVDADKGGLPQCMLRELTGDGRAEIVLRRRYADGPGKAETLEVLSFRQADAAPEIIFAHEVAVERGGRRIDNAVRFFPAGRRTRSVVRPGRNRRASEAEREAFEALRSTDAELLILPWGEVASQTYTLRAGKFALTGERSRPSAPAAPPSPPRVAPRRQSSAVSRPSAPPPDLDRVYAHYRKQAGVRGGPRFDLRANLAGDREKERLVVHGRDIVVFGEGFRQGKGYSVLALSMFTRDRDIRSVKARDLTGDGLAEVIVTGAMRSEAPGQATADEVRHRVVYIYKLVGESFRRIFAAELERSIGSQRIVGGIRYPRAGRIELVPSRSVGFREDSYPFGPGDEPSAGVAPLVLPWEERRAARFRFVRSSGTFEPE